MSQSSLFVVSLSGNAWMWAMTNHHYKCITCWQLSKVNASKWQTVLILYRIIQTIQLSLHTNFIYCYWGAYIYCRQWIHIQESSPHISYILHSVMVISSYISLEICDWSGWNMISVSEDMGLISFIHKQQQWSFKEQCDHWVELNGFHTPRETLCYCDIIISSHPMDTSVTRKQQDTWRSVLH